MKYSSASLLRMTDNKDILDQIADEVGEITDRQESDDENEPAREGEEFNIDEFLRSKDDYDGGW